MSKPVIVLDSHWQKHQEFTRWYYDIIHNSSFFDIRYEDLPINRTVDRMKAETLIEYPLFVKENRFGDLVFFKINGKLVALDSWSHFKYLRHFIRRGLFTNADISLYIKLDEIDKVKEELKLKVTNWIMFPGGQKFVECFKWQNKQHKYLTMFTSGKGSLHSMSRIPWQQYCLNRSDIPTQLRFSEAEYKEILSECKFGSAFSRNEYKNTREYESISCGMPLALNYKPRYDFPFKPFEHYMYLTTPEDLGRLEHIDAEPYAKASQFIWDNYYSPDAACKYLFHLVTS